MEFIDNSLLIMIAAVFLSRYINARAIKKLPMEKKAELIDGFSSFGIWSILPLFVIFAVFYFTVEYVEKSNLLYFGLFALVTLAYIVGIQIYIYKKLINMNYPMSYIKQYILSVLVRFVAFIALVYPLVKVLMEISVSV